jgi:CTP synthase (UTP-ammonia lyase)
VANDSRYLFCDNLQILVNFILALYVSVAPVKGTVQPEVFIIELGGTIGMPFVKAFRQFQFGVKVIEGGHLREKIFASPMSHWCHNLEQRVKPKPNPLRPVCENCGLGLTPDLIMCRFNGF